MKKIETLLILLLPIVAVSQEKGYTGTYSGLDTLKEAGKPINTTQKKIDFNDDKTFAEAIITISGVKKADSAKVKLTGSNDFSKAIPPNAWSEDKLVFDLISVVENAKGLFDIAINGVSKGKFQFAITAKNNSNAGGGDNTTGSKAAIDYVGAIANANFVGNNKFLSNLTPMVTMGITVPFVDKVTNADKKRRFAWNFDVNPYLGGQIDTKDSASFVPALMLPGRVGVMLNNYLTWSGEKLQFTFMPLGFGLKLIPNIKDSNTVVFQHNFRTGIALGYADVFLLGVQYTHGFHNTTSESSRFYSAVFGKAATDIDYLTISGQFYIKSSDGSKNFIYIEWRGLTSPKNYAPFTNVSILTVGYRSDLSLAHIFAAAKGSTRKINRSLPF